MQINNNRPVDFYPPVPIENRNNTRLPVVFDVSGSNTSLSPQRADNTSVVLPAIQSQDGQQARFVRNFISSDRRFDGDNTPVAMLPRSVQQYLFINAMPDQTPSQRGQILDEMA